jgi:hypothetical protein
VNPGLLVVQQRSRLEDDGSRPRNFVYRRASGCLLYGPLSVLSESDTKKIEVCAGKFSD